MVYCNKKNNTITNTKKTSNLDDITSKQNKKNTTYKKDKNKEVLSDNKKVKIKSLTFDELVTQFKYKDLDFLSFENDNYSLLYDKNGEYRLYNLTYYDFKTLDLIKIST